MPAPDGLSANIELSRIAGKVLLSASTPNQDVENTLWMLDQWSSTLPPSLQLADGVSPDQAVCSLHMHHNHLVILAIRPLLLHCIKRLFAEHLSDASATIDTHPQVAHLRACAAAAERNINLTRHILSLTRRKLLHVGLSQLFTSALVLLLYDMAPHSTTPTEERPSSSSHVDFAVEVFHRVAMTGDRYGTVCSETLRSLQLAVARLSSPNVGHMAGMVNDVSFTQGEVSAMGGGGMVYDDLMAWMDRDWPMVDGYLNQS